MRRYQATFLFLAMLAATLRADTWLVVPLSNLSDKPSLDWIGESIAESITEALTREGILVVEREDRKEGERRLALKPNIRWTRASLLRLAEALDANRVVFGTVELSASTEGPSLGVLKLNAQIINVRDLRRDGTFTETGPIEDLASLQSHLSWRVLASSAPKSAPSEEQFRAARADTRLDAMESYVRGLLAQAPDAKERYFQQALKLDARYSQAAFQYGRLLFLKNNQPSAALQLEKVKSWDPHYRFANFMLGIAKFRLNDFKSSEAAFERVTREVPLSEVLNNLGAAQFRLGMPEALENFRRALEGDDKDPTYHFNLGLALLSRGAHAEASEQFRATLDRDPKDQEATKLLGRSLRPQAGGAAKEDLHGLERLKLEYEEAAYQQLKLLVAPQKK